MPIVKHKKMLRASRDISCILGMLFFCLLMTLQTGYAQGLPGLSSPIFKTRAPVHAIMVVQVFDHDPAAFTQGLTIHRGYLYESTGLRGRSSLAKKDLTTGAVLQEVKLAEAYFGEGIAILNGRIIQLTYTSGIAFIYDLETFKPLGQFRYQGEGWGLTTDGKNLLMSNGSSTITVRDPDTFAIIREIHVRDGKIPVNRINEMEFINGEIWANILLEDVIVRICPQKGVVLGWIDLKPLYSYLPRNRQVDVLNGVAYDRDADRVFVTGKLWPKLFEIRLIK